MTLQPLDSEARVLPFRRRHAAVRIRRRRLVVRLGLPFAQALLLVGLPLLTCLWLFSSPSFALSDVKVGGVDHLAAGWVRHALAPLEGQNLLLLSLADVEGRLAVSPWIERVVAGKRLPHRLEVVITERTPAALARQGSELWFVDAGGRLIAPCEPGHGAVDLVLLDAAAPTPESLAAALATAAELAAANPEWARRLSEVEVLGDGDFRLLTGALAFPLVVRQGTLEARLRDLARWLPEIERRYAGVRAIDLRFANRIVFEPAAAPPAAAASGIGKERSPAWQSPNST